MPTAPDQTSASSSNPDLRRHAEALVARRGKILREGEVLAKVLTPNEDASRHGVVIPASAYDFFPELPIADPSTNVNVPLPAFDARNGIEVELSYIYYQRYPERRLTRVPKVLSNRGEPLRLLMLMKASHTDGTHGYYYDYATSTDGDLLVRTCNAVFGPHVTVSPGLFLRQAIDTPSYVPDAILNELLGLFDGVKDQWIDSMRKDDTGIGYTFEQLIGIEENNSPLADYKGIEIKCKGMKEDAAAAGGKMNLFQKAPTWFEKKPNRERIKEIGTAGEDGLYTCYSQLTTSANNLGLRICLNDASQWVDLQKNGNAIGRWAYPDLAKRLAEKHSRAVVVKADKRIGKVGEQFRYKEVIYCERPTIGQFMNLADQKAIVFEFLMREKSAGRVKNHGYPWRLVRESFLENLYSLQIKVR